MLTPLITEIQRFSLQDGPGIRTTIYLKGCPLHCPWCHNPETLHRLPDIYCHAGKCTACGRCLESCAAGAMGLTRTVEGRAVVAIDRGSCTRCLQCVAVCPSGALEVVGRSLEMGKLVQEALSDRVFYKHSGGGVTISGGEPLLYPEYLLELTQKLKKEGNVHLAMETSCFASWSQIEPLLDFIDLFIVDIKTMSAEKYREVIGGSLEVTLGNVERLLAADKAVRIHLPIIPGFNDSRADTGAFVGYLGPLAGKLSGVDVLPFHCYATGKYAQLGLEYQYQGIKDLEGQQVMPLVTALRQRGLQVTVGGIAERSAPCQAAEESKHRSRAASFSSAAYSRKGGETNLTR